METFLGIDYPTLWFIVVGFLFTGYAVLDGFDFGAGAWHLFFKKDEERRLAMNAVGPVWDGNEVWLVIAGGALFAGFPIMYATLFSSLYVPFMLFLVFIIFRAVSIEFRGKEEGKRWRKTWDIAYSVSSIALGFLLGVVLGNLIHGIAVGPNYLYEGPGFFEFLNPYALLVGLTSLLIFMVHGGIFLTMKTEGDLQQQVMGLRKKANWVFIAVYVVLTIVSLSFYPHLMDKLKEAPALWIIPVLALAAIAAVPWLNQKEKHGQAFIVSTLSIIFLIATVAMELYPNMLLSSVDPQHNLDIYNAASSQKTLGIMLTIVAMGTPLFAVYIAFLYRSYKGKVRLDENSY